MWQDPCKHSLPPLPSLPSPPSAPPSAPRDCCARRSVESHLAVSVLLLISVVLLVRKQVHTLIAMPSALADRHRRGQRTSHTAFACAPSPFFFSLSPLPLPLRPVLMILKFLGHLLRVPTFGILIRRNFFLFTEQAKSICPFSLLLPFASLLVPVAHCSLRLVCVPLLCVLSAPAPPVTHASPPTRPAVHPTGSATLCGDGAALCAHPLERFLSPRPPNQTFRPLTLTFSSFLS